MQLIDKGKLIETIQQIPCWECDGHGIDECYSCIIERVVDAPAVDAVEVVRCKDCKHWFSNVAGYTGDEIGHCEWAGWMVGKNGCCVYGERKEVQE